MRKNLPSILLLAASAVLAVVSLILLPQTVVTQLSLGGSGVTTMPKLLAVALPFALGAGGAAAALLKKEDAAARKKGWIISGVGVLVFLIMLAVNCLDV